jgi:hypothetical protein
VVNYGFCVTGHPIYSRVALKLLKMLNQIDWTIDASGQLWLDANRIEHVQSVIAEPTTFPAVAVTTNRLTHQSVI